MTVEVVTIIRISSDANASELLENLEEMFLRNYMHSDVLNVFKSSTTQYCVTSFEMVNIK